MNSDENVDDYRNQQLRKVKRWMPAVIVPVILEIALSISVVLVYVASLIACICFTFGGSVDPFIGLTASMLLSLVWTYAVVAYFRFGEPVPRSLALWQLRFLIFVIGSLRYLLRYLIKACLFIIGAIVASFILFQLARLVGSFIPQKQPAIDLKSLQARAENIRRIFETGDRDVTVAYAKVRDVDVREGRWKVITGSFQKDIQQLKLQARSANSPGKNLNRINLSKERQALRSHIENEIVAIDVVSNDLASVRRQLGALQDGVTAAIQGEMDELHKLETSACSPGGKPIDTGCKSFASSLHDAQTQSNAVDSSLNSKISVIDSLSSALISLRKQMFRSLDELEYSSAYNEKEISEWLRSTGPERKNAILSEWKALETPESILREQSLLNKMFDNLKIRKQALVLREQIFIGSSSGLAYILESAIEYFQVYDQVSDGEGSTSVISSGRGCRRRLPAGFLAPPAISGRAPCQEQWQLVQAPQQRRFHETSFEAHAAKSAQEERQETRRAGGAPRQNPGAGSEPGQDRHAPPRNVCPLRYGFIGSVSGVGVFPPPGLRDARAEGDRHRASGGHRSLCVLWAGNECPFSGGRRATRAVRPESAGFCHLPS